MWKDISSQYISIRFQITWSNLINEDNSSLQLFIIYMYMLQCMYLLFMKYKLLIYI